MSDIDWGKVLLATIQGGLIGIGLYYVTRWQQRRKEKAASQSDVPSTSPVTTERLASPASPTPTPVAPESSPPNSATGSDGEEPQYCSQCNQPVVATAKFCGGCGAAIQSPVVQKPSAPILRSPRLVPVTPTPAPVEDAQPATPPAGNTGRTKPRWGALEWGMVAVVVIPIILVVLLIIGGVGGFFEQPPASYAERGNTAATDPIRLRLEANQGDATAQYQLGSMYALGNGVPQDDAEAVRWYRLAADQGNPLAQTNLGYMYSTGRGVPQNDVQAVRWNRLAADQGSPTAQSNLGYMYSTGQGVSQDPVQAYKWYSLAAAQSTGTDRDDAVEARDEIANRLTPAQRAEAQRLAREWDEAHPR